MVVKNNYSNSIIYTAKNKTCTTEQKLTIKYKILLTVVKSSHGVLKTYYLYTIKS